MLFVTKRDNERVRPRARERVRDAAGPLVPTVGVIALVQDQWEAWWQPRHHVLSRLSRYFHVLWLNAPHHWRVTRDRWRSHAPVMIEPSPGLTVYTPEIWLPLVYKPQWLQDTMLRGRLRQARRRLISQGCTTFILYLWRPEFAPALCMVRCDQTCYHIDDEYSFSPVEAPIDAGEAQLIAAVDQVFIHSPALLEKKGSINPNTFFTPNGVDYEAYAASSPEPLDLQGITRPRIGYTGFIKPQLDWQMLVHLATQHREWSFVFVGPGRDSDPALDELSRLRNVHFLGGKTVQALATYPQHFDVCIMPYRIDDYTKYIYPMKLHEYLATGRPTVGARIRSLEEFADVVALAETREEWSSSIRAMLGANARSSERCISRQAVAKKFDWNIIVQRIAEQMTRRLDLEFSSVDTDAIG